MLVNCTAILLAWTALASGSETEARGSYLCRPAYCLDEALRGPTEAYMPQPGDIMLSAGRSPLLRACYRLGLTDRPFHAAIVVARPDGSLAILQTGKDGSRNVGLFDALPELRAREQLGSVWIRRRRAPLTTEQSARLTAYAQAQSGSPFALGRLILQLTPWRSRGPLRTEFMGKPRDDRHAYICTELVVEACISAGLLDPEITRPSATYPRDLFFDESSNAFIARHPLLRDDWHPPARWISNALGDASVTRSR